MLSKGNGKTADELNAVKREHEVHLCAANEALQQTKTDLQLAVTCNTVETLTFDLQKVISLPCILRNIIYYKGHLSMYNLGINSGKQKVGHFNVWLENDAMLHRCSLQ